MNLEQEHINLLSIDNYILMSDITNEIYIDEQFNCHIFDKKSKAELFIKEHSLKSVKPILNNHKKPKEFCELLYSMGFRMIKYTRKDVLTEIGVEKPALQIGYHNAYASGVTLRLLQTGEKKYLRGLYNAKFFTPVSISDRDKGKHPNIIYNCASLKNSKKNYLLFTTLSEFEEWNKSQKQDWKPLKMSIMEFERIRNNYPIILNPLSSKIVLKNEHIKIIKEGKNG